jgi:hypothetical protein
LEEEEEEWAFAETILKHFSCFRLLLRLEAQWAEPVSLTFHSDETW